MTADDIDTIRRWVAEYAKTNGGAVAHALATAAADLITEVDELTADVESLNDDLSAVRTERDALVGRLDAFKPVAYPSGEQLYVHGCRNAEWWNEATRGPVNEQGCDACESAPDGTWRPVYVGGGA